MAEEQRIVQPLVIMQPPADPEATFVDEQAERFIEDTTVEGGLTFAEWVAKNKPIQTPPPDTTAAADVPEI
jgi:hypothetical protein